MEKVWEFFENMSELVYVTDMDTYDLIYMNRCAREAFGFSEEEVQGKTCYKAIQGREEPCEFCNNAQLTPGNFIEWNYKNLVVNRSFALKDTVIEQDGRRCRLEIAIDVSQQKQQEQDIQSFIYSEAITNECLRLTHSTTDPDESLTRLLAYLGQKLGCDRSYIFENEGNDYISNTYEWTAAGVPSEKENLQRQPWEIVARWRPLFYEGKSVTVDDIETIRESDPMEYACLKSQGIKSMVICPLQYKGEVIGFYGVDNPTGKLWTHITTMLQVMGHFIVSILKRRDLIRRLEYISYHDQLTGALNRHAMEETISALRTENSVGLVYCDISGLKNINDSRGHTAGDCFIQSAYKILISEFDSTNVFRIGGDEFLVICIDCLKWNFEQKVSKLRENIRKSGMPLSVGMAWEPAGYKDIKTMMVQADKRMYQDKQAFYDKIIHFPGRSFIRASQKILPAQQADSGATTFQRFITNHYYNSEALFQSVTMSGAPYYLYFGDLQDNFFYVSDNMRDDFGFTGNIIFDLLDKWAALIDDPQDKSLFQQDMQQIMEQKKNDHSLRYRITDKNGARFWIHCRGVIQWSDDRMTPLFFSGCVSRLENDFVLDPTTGFLRIQAALNELSLMKDKQMNAAIIGFGLNHFTYINESKGRDVGDKILRDISDELLSGMEKQFAFYRLDGIRFMAIAQNRRFLDGPEHVWFIRRVVEKIYNKYGISSKGAVSLGVLEYPRDAGSPQELLENTLTLITIAKNSPDIEYSEFSRDRIAMQKSKSDIVLGLSESVEDNFNGFRIVVQPIVSAKGGRIVGGETLLRWNYKGQEISPGVFIPLLEENQLILQVGKWVFEQTVCTGKRILAYQPDFRLSFNVSYLQVLDDNFLSYMEETLKNHNFSGSHLMMELTETHFDEMPAYLLQFVNRCHELGMAFALDDFGTAYSSLQMLLKYPADIIKLDRTLMREITLSKENLDFIMSIVYSCHRQNKQVCVEGVETEEELSIVRKTRCDVIQGFYFYKPMELKELYCQLSVT